MTPSHSSVLHGLLPQYMPIALYGVCSSETPKHIRAAALSITLNIMGDVFQKSRNVIEKKKQKTYKQQKKSKQCSWGKSQIWIHHWNSKVLTIRVPASTKRVLSLQPNKAKNLLLLFQSVAKSEDSCIFFLKETMYEFLLFHLKPLEPALRHFPKVEQLAAASNEKQGSHNKDCLLLSVNHLSFFIFL